MKTNKLIIFLLAVVTSISFTSCVEDGDFEVPESIGNEQEPNLTGTQVTFSSVKARLSQSGGLGTYESNEDIYILGYVVSSDATGNFFEELMIQNTPNDTDLTNEPRMGIKLNIDVNNMYNKYNFGRKVYLKLGGLTVTEDSGVLTIGKLNSSAEFSNIEDFEIDKFLFRSKETVEIKPKVTTIENLSENDLNTIVTINDLQVADTSRGLTFAGEENDQFDAERLLTSCVDGSSIVLSTSTFSDFKSHVLPDDSGSVTAVYLKDFFGSTDVLKVNKKEDIKFTENRCDLSVNLTANLTIKELRNLYKGSNVLFAPGSDKVVEGYIVSSDIKGNFFKNIYIQDKPENPTAAIQVLADENNLFQSYPIGSKVVIRLDRLYLGEAFGDILSLGYLDGSDVDRIDRGDISKFIINTGVRADIIPTPAQLGAGNIVTIDEYYDHDDNPLTPDIIRLIDHDNDPATPLQAAQVTAPQGILIKVDNVQMPKSTIGEAYAFYSGTTSANRIIESCETGNSIILRNSGFADFANQQFPTGKGSIVAVSSSFGSTAQLLIRSTADVDLSGVRCDPPELDCGNASVEGSNILFEDMFETQTINSAISGNGWTNYQQEGTETWEAYTATGTNSSQGVSARVGSFRSGDASTVAWLITPEIDLDANSGVTISFETSNSFADASNLEVMLSNDWDGTTQGITTATWLILPAAYITQDSDPFSTWFSSGIVDLSCGSGKAHIAFKYSGSGSSGNDGTYELDNIKIASN